MVDRLRAGGSAWLERSADNRKVESSNLSRPTTDSPGILFERVKQ